MAIDQCEPQVIRAFEKAGWVVAQRPVAIHILGDLYFADLQIREAATGQTRIVEVKCFPDPKRTLGEFYKAVGQYLMYRVALEAQVTPDHVYLAVPRDVYRTFFQRPSIELEVKYVRMPLVVIDLNAEEIVLWQT